MARMPLRLHFFLALWLSATSWAGSVEFFYNLEKDTCNWGTVSLPAHNNTANGGLCAYVAATKRVFACPAPDHVCWTLDQSCAGENGTLPGPDQIQCNRNNAIWCCQNGETCSTTKDQINVCWGQFSSLNNDVPVDAAVSAEYSAIPSSQIATTSVTAVPSAFSTVAFGANVATTSSITSSSTQTSTSRASSTGSSNNHNSSQSKGLSGGAIAGIVIGVLVGIALVAGAVAFALVRHRRARGHAPADTDSGSNTPEHQIPMTQQEMEGHPFMAPHELYGSQPHQSRQYSDRSPSGTHEVDGGPSSSVSQLPSDEVKSGTVTSGSVYSQPSRSGLSPLSGPSSGPSPSSAPPVRHELQ